MSTITHLPTLSLLTQHAAPHCFGSSSRRHLSSSGRGLNICFTVVSAHSFQSPSAWEVLTVFIQDSAVFSNVVRARGQPPDIAQGAHSQWQMPDVWASQHHTRKKSHLVLLLDCNCKGLFAPTPLSILEGNIFVKAKGEHNTSKAVTRWSSVRKTNHEAPVKVLLSLTAPCPAHWTGSSIT